MLSLEDQCRMASYIKDIATPRQLSRNVSVDIIDELLKNILTVLFPTADNELNFRPSISFTT